MKTEGPRHLNGAARQEESPRADKARANSPANRTESYQTFNHPHHQASPHHNVASRLSPVGSRPGRPGVAATHEGAHDIPSDVPPVVRPGPGLRRAGRREHRHRGESALGSPRLARPALLAGGPRRRVHAGVSRDARRHERRVLPGDSRRRGSRARRGRRRRYGRGIVLDARSVHACVHRRRRRHQYHSRNADPPPATSRPCSRAALWRPITCSSAASRGRRRPSPLSASAGSSPLSWLSRCRQSTSCSSPRSSRSAIRAGLPRPSSCRTSVG